MPGAGLGAAGGDEVSTDTRIRTLHRAWARGEVSRAQLDRALERAGLCEVPGCGAECDGSGFCGPHLIACGAERACASFCGCWECPVFTEELSETS